jgi:hypothetical protein
MTKAPKNVSIHWAAKDGSASLADRAAGVVTGKLPPAEITPPGGKFQDVTITAVKLGDPAIPAVVNRGVYPSNIYTGPPTTVSAVAQDLSRQGGGTLCVVACRANPGQTTLTGPNAQGQTVIYTRWEPPPP